VYGEVWTKNLHVLIFLFTIHMYIFVRLQGIDSSRVSRPICGCFHVQRWQTQFGKQCCKFLFSAIVQAYLSVH